MQSFRTWALVSLALVAAASVSACKKNTENAADNTASSADLNAAAPPATNDMGSTNAMGGASNAMSGSNAAGGNSTGQ